MHHHNLDKCTRVESSRLSEMCVRERCIREFLPQPRTDRCNSSIYMRSLAYLSFDFLFGVFCSRISQRSLFWTSAAQPDRIIERRERERTNGRQKNGKNLKWMKPVPSVVLTIPFFISLTRRPRSLQFFFRERKHSFFFGKEMPRFT